MELSDVVRKKLNNITSFLSGKKVLVAFSGGVDSALLGYLSSKYAKETLLITEKSILYPEEEIEEARNFANSHNIPHEILERHPLNDKEFQCNPENRCYLCKTGLYQDILEVKKGRNFDVILDGSNADDLLDYRPGMQALIDLGIFTPYVEYNIYKQEIREISKFFNLSVQSKPSMACFSSRVPYGQEINEEKLNRIREGERFLKNTFNLKQLRVRHHENGLARIELLQADFPNIFKSENLNLIKKKFKEIGFNYITIDLDGFRSGSMNEVLTLN